MGSKASISSDLCKYIYAHREYLLQASLDVFRDIYPFSIIRRKHLSIEAMDALDGVVVKVSYDDGEYQYSVSMNLYHSSYNRIINDEAKLIARLRDVVVRDAIFGLHLKMLDNHAHTQHIYAELTKAIHAQLTNEVPHYRKMDVDYVKGTISIEYDNGTKSKTIMLLYLFTDRNVAELFEPE
ncbi:MAG: hypothetical protein GX801_11425 [Fibrobacter sp.]|nr:hypothetical protein [Fibrobacter sp.]